MNVLSVFDGMSCGQIALDRLGIKVNKYYASEIKPHAIKVTKENYQNTIHLGDIRNVKAIDLDKIDMFIGGSPCQDFSRGNAKRDGLDGEKSSLFFEWYRLFKEINPRWFLLENVVMNKEDENYISELLGITPRRINSSTVSAQLRDRLYWTNMCEYDTDLFGNKIARDNPPADKKISLQGILTDGFTDRYKARALLESDSRPLKSQDKMWHRYKNTGFTTVVFEDKSMEWECGLRYLNQTELERCQTVPEGYTRSLTRNQAACLLGDGWTVDVICHILKDMK